MTQTPGSTGPQPSRCRAPAQPTHRPVTSNGPIVKTSQVALPEEARSRVYETEDYEQSLENRSRSSLSSDMVPGDDGGIHQPASMTGSVENGYVAALAIGVQALG